LSSIFIKNEDSLLVSLVVLFESTSKDDNLEGNIYVESTRERMLIAVGDVDKLTDESDNSFKSTVYEQ
jgi:hypothetical protein